MAPVHGAPGRALTGLRNLGNTCFMNSILQCLSNAVPLAMFFIQNRHTNAINRSNKMGTKGELAEEFGELLKALWLRDYKHISPSYFKQSVGKFRKEFQGTQQQDSQEFCAFLLDGLHEDLNRITHKPYVEHPNYDTFSDAEAAAKSWEIHKRREDSPIVDLFQGQFKSTIRCRVCSYASKSFSPFTFLSLPMPARGSRTSLKQCVLNFSQKELVTGDDSWYCNNCKCHRDAVKEINIYKLPTILVIQMKRFYFEGPFRSKIETLVDFPLQGLVLDEGSRDNGTRQKNFSLFGVANHYGSLTGGHYTAFCKNFDSQKWYQFDDSKVSHIGESRICSNSAYMLFYSAKNFDSPDLF